MISGMREFEKQNLFIEKCTKKIMGDWWVSKVNKNAFWNFLIRQRFPIEIHKYKGSNNVKVFYKGKKYAELLEEK